MRVTIDVADAPRIPPEAAPRLAPRMAEPAAAPDVPPRPAVADAARPVGAPGPVVPPEGAAPKTGGAGLAAGAATPSFAAAEPGGAGSCGPGAGVPEPGAAVTEARSALFEGALHPPSETFAADAVSDILSAETDAGVAIGEPTAPGRGSERMPVAPAGAGALPPGIAHRLAEALAQVPDGPVEVTLSPEELGRVRMSLTTQDGALTMVLHADRPETLDLMRRHIDSLARDFRELGFDDLTFSFGERPDSRHSPKPGSAARADGDAGAAAAPPAAPPLARTLPADPGGGLDLRV